MQATARMAFMLSTRLHLIQSVRQFSLSYVLMTTQPKPTWLRTSLPDSRSVPYFVPAWLVFAYIAAEAALDWPRAQYLGVFFAVAQLVAQVPRGIHSMTLRQWFMAAAVLPTVATVLLFQAIKLTMHNS